MLRMELARINPEMVVEGEWVAREAIHLVTKVKVDPKVSDLYQRSFKQVEEWIMEIRAQHTGRVTGPGRLPKTDLNHQAAACLILAKMDMLYRTGTIDEHVNVYEPSDLEDLLELYHLVPWASFRVQDHVPLLLNPEFGSLSNLFNGADADFIAGPSLIDFKTTKYLDLVKHVPQLVGYSILSRIYRETEAPDFPVLTEAGIYFARHGILACFSLQEVYGSSEYDDIGTGLDR